jgi:hypothetical protein
LSDPSITAPAQSEVSAPSAPWAWLLVAFSVASIGLGIWAIWGLAYHPITLRWMVPVLAGVGLAWVLAVALTQWLRRRGLDAGAANADERNMFEAMGPRLKAFGGLLSALWPSLWFADRIWPLFPTGDVWRIAAVTPMMILLAWSVALGARAVIKTFR